MGPDRPTPRRRRRDSEAPTAVLWVLGTTVILLGLVGSSGHEAGARLTPAIPPPTSGAPAGAAVPGGGAGTRPVAAPALSENRSASNYIVLRTLDLLNHTVVAGNLANPVQCTDPVGSAFDPTGTLLYVACSVSQNVVVVDLATATVLRGIPVGSNPSAIVYDPYVHAFYVANEGSNNVSVFTTGALTPQATIAVGATPSAFALNTSGSQVFVADSGSNSIAVIDPQTNKTVRTVFAGFDPVGVAYDALQDDLIASNNPIHNLTVINAGTGHVVATLAVGSGPSAVLDDAASHRVFVSNSLSDNLSVVNMATVTVTGAVGLGSFPGALVEDPSTFTLFVAEQSSSNLTVVNATSLGTTGSIPINGFPAGLAWDGVRHQLEVDDSANTTADLVNVSGRSVAVRLPLAATPGRLAYDALTGEVYVALPYLTDVAVLDGATAREAHLVDLGLRPAGLGADPQNGSVMVATFDSYHPVVIDGISHQVIARPYVPGFSVTATFNPLNSSWYVPLYDPQPLGFPLTGSVTEVVDGPTLADLKFLGIGWCFTVPDGTFDPVNDTFFQVNSDCANATVYSAKTYQLLKIIPTGLSPSRIVYDPQLGEMFIANAGTNNLTVLNATTYATVGTIPVGLQPEGLGYDPRTGFLFVANSGSDDVMIVNASTQHVVADLVVGQSPFDIAIDSANSTVYVTNAGSGTVSVLGPSPFTSLSATPTHPTVLLGGSASVTAQALDATGSPLPGASYHWTYAPSLLGILNSSTGAQVTFTAGSTVGNGTLWVNATFGPITREAVVALSVVPPTLVVSPLTASPALLLIGGSTTLTVRASGGVAPYRYVYSGLPPGCTGANAATIDCLPAQAGVYTISVTVYDSAGQSQTETLSLYVTTLTRVVVSAPQAVAAVGRPMSLSANGFDGFGNRIANATLRWTLVPLDLGTLNRSTGTNVTFTAGGAEPGGTIWANATYRGTTVGAPIEVVVTGSPTSPTNPSSGPSLLEWGLAGLGLAGAAVLVAVVVLRRRGRGPTEPATLVTEDPELPELDPERSARDLPTDDR